jgi:thiosulfate reductase cytochrome b subunit
MSETTASMASVADAASHSPARIYIYKRYERFWHWSQALLIIAMLISGFEVHGSYTLLGFEPAVRLHTLAAWLLLVLWAFTIFWQFTTGEWRQYLPTHKKVVAMAMYYSWGMFRGAPHPFHKTVQKKHNPLQRLAYLGLLAMISPLIWGSGLLYLFRAFWPSLGIDQWLTLEGVAWAHTAGAFLMLTFFIVHVYLTTTGHTPTAHIKSMVTGWEELHDDAHSADTPSAPPQGH